MELRHYLRVMYRWRWLALAAFVSVIVATVVFTYTQTPRYEATASLVVSPAEALTEPGELRDFLNVLDQPIIVNTYAEIAQSQKILEQAWDELGLPPASQDEFEVVSSVLQRTNIVEISVSGPNADIVHEMANATARHAIDYVTDLYKVYNLQLLDPALRPEEPKVPDWRVNLLLGFVLAAGAACGVAFVGEYLREPEEEEVQVSLVDARTGVYSRAYFLHRLQEEIDRSDRDRRSFTVGRVRIDNIDVIAEAYPRHTRDVAVREVVRFLKGSLPDDALVAEWDEQDLMILIPACDRVSAHKMVRDLHTEMRTFPFGVEELGLRLGLTASFGVATYVGNGSAPEDLLAEATEALRQAELKRGGVHHLDAGDGE